MCRPEMTTPRCERGEVAMMAVEHLGKGDIQHEYDDTK